jgi:CSLREA domain-containing protein
MKKIVKLFTLVLAITGASIQAATFNVADGDFFGLRVAIAKADSNGEADVINLAIGGTYSVDLAEEGPAGPSSMVIEGDGAHPLTINGNGSILQRTDFLARRILRIAAGAVVTLNQLSLNNGSGSREGAGILNEGGTLELVECTLSNNSVSAVVARGGAIFQVGGKLTLRRCTIVSNGVAGQGATGATTRGEGGGIYNAGGIVEVQLCTFSANGASSQGSSADSTAKGGAIANTGSSGRLVITNSTFNGNNAAGVNAEGKTISSTSDGATVEIGNTIIFGTAPVFSGAVTSRGYNLTNSSTFGSGPTDGDQLNTDPQLLPLAFNGGQTRTHAITLSSPATDKGKRDAIPALAVTTDQRGSPRPVDHPGIPPAAGGDNSDIGAYEIGLPQTAATLTVTNGDDHDNGLCSDDDCTLREAITAANALAGDNTIGFAAGVTGTIQLRSALPNLASNITIDGPGADRLTVRRDTQFGGSLYRIFTSSNGTSTGPTVSLLDMTISNGRGSGTPANGGGVYNDHGTLRIERCRINLNAATNAAGLWSVGGSTTVVESTIDHNEATGVGGGILNSGTLGNAALTLTNVTLENNSASGGGAAIYNAGPSGAATVTLQNVTISNNFFSASIYNDGSNSNVSPRNSIFSPRLGYPSFTNVNGATITSLGYNISSDPAGGDGGTGPGGVLTHPTDRRNTDPKLAAGLDFHGGGTPTVALRGDSPAVNTADQNSAPPRDQRGFLRAGPPDIGAFEFGGTLPVTLANLSTRLRVETGDNVLIGGFIVGGSSTASKRVIVRALGPSVPVPGTLADPQLKGYNGRGHLTVGNDNWRSTQEAAIRATGIPPGNDLEAAAIFSPTAGPYTIVVSGADGGTGIALVEIYDLDRTVPAKLINLSTRGLVQGGDNVMIGGFIILGADQQKIILRAIGPSLSLSNKLANPVLELHDGNGATIATNDNWKSDQRAEIEATGIPPTNDLESAMIRTLAPGSYTAILRSADSTIGVAVVEVYALEQ